jgi:hypothetical protein
MRRCMPFVLLLACNDPSVGADGGAAPAIDAPIDAPESDAGESCGDGVVDAGEACDGSPRACIELGATWISGDATCRADCRGWDVASCVPGAAQTFEIVKPAERDAERWGSARCNDGTPFGFAIRLAPVPTASWVIHLEGGVLCDDDAFSCADRLRDDEPLTTTPRLADRATTRLMRAGILSDDPSLNPFAGHNQVLAFYCSSDHWSGATIERRPTSADPAGWYFSGRANVSALLETLVDRYGLSDADPETRVLWGGSSAGAFGAHINVPRVREALPSTFAARRVALFADAGWMIDYDDPEHRIRETSVRDREVWRAALAFWDGHVNADCEAAHVDPVDCWFGPAWYETISAQIPVLVQQSEIDGSFGNFLHAFDGCDAAGQCSDPEVQAALDAWRAQLVAELAGAEWLFSGSMRYHTLAMADAGLSTGAPGSTLRDVLARFWEGAPPERVTFDLP